MGFVAGWRNAGSSERLIVPRLKLRAFAELRWREASRELGESMPFPLKQRKLEWASGVIVQSSYGPPDVV